MPNMPNTYRTTLEAEADKAALDQLRMRLNGAKTTMRRDGSSLWTLRGREENYISTFGDGSTWLIYLQCRSGVAWTWAKKRLLPCGCVVTQDGDEEGCLRLTRLPVSAVEAREIRELVGIRQPGPVTNLDRPPSRQDRGHQATIGA